MDQFLKDHKTQEAQDYYDVQVWVNQNSNKKDMFMIDPSITGGWLAFSNRSSFGNFRDWLVWTTTFSYNEKEFKLGVEKLIDLGINYQDYIGHDSRIQSNMIYHLMLEEKIIEEFYNLDISKLNFIIRKYDVDYIVYKKKLYNSKYDKKIVFENTNFIILKSS